MNRTELVSLIAQTVTDFQSTRAGANATAQTVDANTLLFGNGGLLDSMGLVSVVLDVEQRVNDKFDTSITLADDRAMSQRRSPFRSVESLAEYAETLINEEKQKPGA